MKNLFLFLIMILLSGCTYFTRTVYVPYGQSVRLRETVKKVDIYAKTEQGETVEGNIDLPEGWYCLPLTND